MPAKKPLTAEEIDLILGGYKPTAEEREARIAEIEPIVTQLEVERKKLWDLSDQEDDASNLGAACTDLGDTIEGLRNYVTALRAGK